MLMMNEVLNFVKEKGVDSSRGNWLSTLQLANYHLVPFSMLYFLGTTRYILGPIGMIGSSTTPI